MSLKKMVLLAEEIDRLTDSNQRLIVENDLLRKQIRDIETSGAGHLLTQDIKRLDILDVVVRRLTIKKAA